jgi:hypothetical protein
MKKFLLFVLAITLCLSCSKGAPDAPHLGALASPGQVGPFVFPPSWLQSAWFVDPANTSTCASDNNRTCSLSTCGTSGDGPCATFGSIATRWGTYTPRIKQNTSITLMSSATTDTDVWYLGPYPLEAGAAFIVQGTISTVQATTLSAVTAKNRAGNQALLATFTASAGITAGMLVVNSTHPSVAWTYKNISGAQWMMSQPGTASNQSTPQLRNCLNPSPEVDTWAPGDTVTVSSVPVANFSTASSIVQGESNSTFANGLILYRIGVRVPTGTSGFAPFSLGAGAEFIESEVGILLFPTTAGNTGIANNGGINTAFAGGVVPNLGGPLNFTGSTIGVDEPGTCFAAGYVGTGTTYNIQPISAQFTGDIIFAQGFRNFVNIFYGTVQAAYLDGSTMNIYGNVNVSSSDSSPTVGPFIYGTGTVNVLGNGRMSYPTGAGAAAAAFLTTGGLQIGGQTKTCVSQPADAAPPVCNYTLSPTNLDSALATVNGCVMVLGGGSICNLSN